MGSPVRQGHIWRPSVYEWYCYSCKVMVRQLRCQHCGKEETEASLGFLALLRRW